MLIADQPCGRCHRLQVRQILRGVPVWVCHTCATVTLAQADFDQLCVPSSDLDLPLPEPRFDPAAIRPAAEAHRSRRPSSAWLAAIVLLGSGLVVAALLAIAGAVWLWTSAGDPGGTIVHPREPDEGPILPRVRTGTIEPPTTTDQPAPPAPKPSTIPALIDRGWDTMERSPARAASLFARVLARQPGHADANYGYGYALLAQQRSAEAQPYLCRALINGDAETQREIRALLTRHRLTCNDEAFP